MELTFLGTSFAIPTRKRNHSAMLLTHQGENILVDCGEGTQRQFRKARLNPCKITRLLITHWHGDHILGIPGLFQTLTLNNYNKTLQVYGPRGTKHFIQTMLKMFLFVKSIKLEVHEVKEGIIHDGDLVIKAFQTSHGVPSLAYSIEEKTKRRIDVKKLKKLKLKGPIIGQLQKGKDITFNGKKIKAKDMTYLQEGKKVSFVMDTGIDKNAIIASKNADLMVCEASFLDEDKAKAKEYHHLTASQAGEMAKKAKAKKLYLTHISQRYELKEKEIAKEAKTKFKNTFVAEDLMKVEI
ncbi:ribonuclease Z [Nanoarchaeota archaeon]